MAGIVAVIAFGVCRCMKFRFTDGKVTIMTFTAISKYFLVINRGDNGKIHRCMTGMAIITGSGVTRYFTDCRNAVVARDTVINNARMIKHRGGKRAGNMTGTAILVCYNVAAMLTNCTARTTIMTGVTPFTDNIGIGMINKSVSEINSVMAHPAIFVSAYMNCRCWCSPGPNQNIIGIAVMAGFTVVSDARVNETLCRVERRSGNVAHITILLRWYMCARLSSTDHIVVAGFTVINNTDMIEDTSAKGTRGVAGTAILSCLHVVQWFTARFSGNTSVTAGCCAIIYDTGMIKRRAEKATACMTDTAILVCW